MISYIMPLILLYVNSSYPYNTLPDWIETYSSGITMDAELFDYDSDGYLDLVTAEYSYPNGGNIRVYQNNHSGGFHSIPIWTSYLSKGFESVTIADVNNDGYDDIIAGTVNLMPYDGHNYCFICQGESSPITWSNTPYWISSDSKDTIDIFCADIDCDGYVEVITANIQARILVYDNINGSISSVPNDFLDVCWNSSLALSIMPVPLCSSVTAQPGYHLVTSWAYYSDKHARKSYCILFNAADFLSNNLPKPLWDASSFSQAALAGENFYHCIDLNGDGLLDIAGNTDRFLSILFSSDDMSSPPFYTYNSFEIELIQEAQVYLNEWEVFDPLYRIRFIDVADFGENDGGVDLVVGATGISDPNSNGILFGADYICSVSDWADPEPSISIEWQSDYNCATTNVILADLDRSTETRVVEQFSQTANNQAFLLNSGNPIQSICSIMVNGIELSNTQYHFNRRSSIVSLARDISTFSGDSVSIEYFVSNENDLICITTENNIVYEHKGKGL